MNPRPASEVELISRSPEQTWRLGEALARRLAGGEVVALTGPLGAGKTQWVKGIARGLGIEPEAVHSPSFTLINEYSAAHPPSPLRGEGGAQPPSAVGGSEQPSASAPAPRLLYHVDAYRLRGAAELEAVGFGELLGVGDGIIAVEWADRVARVIPPGAIWIAGSMPSELGPSERRYRIRCDRSGLPAELSRVVGR